MGLTYLSVPQTEILQTTFFLRNSFLDFQISENGIILITGVPSIPNLLNTGNKISVSGTDTQTDRQTVYVNHLCLLAQFTFWLTPAELGAVTIWFPCVYFSPGSVLSSTARFHWEMPQTRRL